MRTIGTTDAGFSVRLDTRENVVHVVGWGFWEPEVARLFDSLVIETCLYVPTGTRLSIDMNRLKPMRDEGQRAFANVIAKLKDIAKIAQISVSTQSQLTKLQLMRIAREVAPKEKIEFV